MAEETQAPIEKCGFAGREAEPLALSLISVRVAAILLIIASLVPVSAALRMDHQFPADDALISLTYAKNLARGDGFVFNHSPPVLATTTPAFTMGVALLTVISGLEPTLVALWTTALCWLALIWVFFVFRNPFGLDLGQATFIGLMIAAQGWVEHLSMEAYPFVLILVLAAAMVWSRQFFLGGFAVGVLFLTRGEGVLFGAILGLIVIADEIKGRRDGRSSTLIFVIGAALPVLVWSAYALPTFGSILPATLAAKMAQVSSGLWAPFPVRLVQEWLPGWGIGPWGATSMVLGYLMVGAGLWVIGVCRRRMLVFPVWGVTYAVAYSVLGVPGYTWYRLPIIFAFTVAAGLGLQAVVRAGLGRCRDRGIRTAVVWGLAAVMILAAGWGTVGAIRTPPNDPRGPAYQAAARWLTENGDPSQSVAFFEVGALGYYSDLGVVDLVGLVTPAVIPHILNRDFATGFWESSPEFLIELEGSEFTRPIVENPRFLWNYVEAAVLDGPEERSLTIYRSRSKTVIESDPPK